MREENAMWKSSAIGGIICAGIIFLTLLILAFFSGSTFAWKVLIFAGVTVFVAFLNFFFFAIEQKKLDAEFSTKILKENYDSQQEIFSQTTGLEERSFNDFSRKTLPILAMILATFMIGGAFYLWQQKIITEISQPVKMLALTVLPLFLTIFSASYFFGLSQNKSKIFFRSMSLWLRILAIFLFLLLSLFISKLFIDFSLNLDQIFTKISLIVMILVGFDLAFSIIFSFYNSDKNKIFIFEPSFTSLILHPTTLVEQVVEVLNYQFGFNFSTTFLKHFFRVKLLIFIFSLIGVFFLFSSIVLINEDSVGFSESFGKVNEKSLPSGIYFKLPYPFGKIRQFPVKKVQELNLGLSKDEKENNEKVVLWTAQHSENEANYLLPTSSSVDNSLAFSYLTITIPMRYLVENPFAYLYKFSDAKKIFFDLGQTELLSAISCSNSSDFLGENQSNFLNNLQKKIQEKANELELGVKILSLNFYAAHPPVEVGKAFEEVAMAMEKKEALILLAQAYKNRKIPEIEGEAYFIINNALAYKSKAEEMAKATVAEFGLQLDAFNVFPQYFKISELLNVLEKVLPERRKYIVPENLQSEQYILNLEDNHQPTLLDIK